MQTDLPSSLLPGSVSTRAWVRLPSGNRLDLLNPSPDAWEDADLALGLARTYRWGGHSAWPLPLSVAQHSILVMLLRRTASPGPLDPLVELLNLLHDSDEGLLGFDAISVIKPFLGDAFKALTKRLEQAVFARYNLPPWSEAEYAAHKLADRTAAASEAVRVAGWSHEEVRNTLEIDAPILAEDPLAAHYGCRPWEPWPPGLACERFLGELALLRQRIDTGR